MPRLAVAVLIVVTSAPASGAGWTTRATPEPAGATGSVLTDIACITGSLCTAVGNHVAANGSVRTLALRWDRARWTVQSTPDPLLGIASGYNAIACASVASCRAVGSYLLPIGFVRPTAAVWTPGGWRQDDVPLPTTSRGGTLDDVSCPSVTECIAVGSFVDLTGSERPLALRWDGAWAVEPFPLPTGASGGVLGGVDCAGPSSCIAVGKFTASNGMIRTLIGRRVGGAWRLDAAPNPRLARGAVLNDVTCLTAVVCAVVGNYTRQDGAIGPLALRRVDGAWRQQVPPIPAGSGVLGGVTCTSASRCTAVGSFTGRKRLITNLIEVWASGRWTRASAPAPRGARGDILNAVWCARSSCIAVGNFTDAAGRIHGDAAYS